jgi:hypothetical protein
VNLPCGVDGLLLGKSVLMRARLPLRMVQLLDQRAAAAGGTVKLDGGVGDVETVLQFMLDAVQQLAALPVIGRLDLDMGREGQDV